MADEREEIMWFLDLAEDWQPHWDGESACFDFFSGELCHSWKTRRAWLFVPGASWTLIVPRLTVVRAIAEATVAGKTAKSLG